jgi:iron-sulfur cluster protein
MSLAEEIRKKEGVKRIILPVIYDYKDKREAIFSALNKDELREKLRKSKERAMENLDRLKKQGILNLLKHGIRVVEARDAKDVRKALADIIGGERLIIKAKSNVANEIGLREMLSDKELIETDIGDFIAEICAEEDGHPVLPAMTLAPEKISAVIKKKFGTDLKPAAEDIVAFVRNQIRQKMISAKIGITGANAITSDGSIMILENEGNISLVSRLAEKHIIIAGFEKIVESKEDAMLVAQCAAVYGTGQDVPVYVNIISGPSKTADVQNQIVTGAQGAREVHLILLDNGRSALLKSEFKELLHCINCGACLNFCPIYHQITKAYGSRYAGARGVLFSAFNEDMQKAFDSGAFYCTMCKTCSENCPAKIDLPGMMKNLRERLVAQGIEPNNAKEMMENVKNFGNPFGKPDGKTPKGLYCC